jgi:hypothetical protein
MVLWFYGFMVLAPDPAGAVSYATVDFDGAPS